MGISLSGMSNPYYQRNRVTGYFGYAQYQEVPNLKTLFSVEICGKVVPSLARSAPHARLVLVVFALETRVQDVLKSDSLKRR